MIPHDLEAERAVIAAALIENDPDWITEILAALNPDDYYSPNHAALWATITDEWNDGRAVDTTHLAAIAPIDNAAAVIADLLDRHASRQRARTHIARVADLAVLRRIQTVASHTLETIGHEPDPVELIDNITGALTDLDIPNDTRPITGLHRAPDLAATDFDEQPPVIPGFLRRLDRLMVVGLEGSGKALDIDTPVPTVDGWTTMGELEADDVVYDRFGDPTRVLWVSDINPRPDAYRVTFSDDSHIDADADHQWIAYSYADRAPSADGTPSVTTTAEIRDTLYARDGHVKNWAIPVGHAIAGPTLDLPIDPYTLGAWLGDGTSRCPALTLNSDDETEIVEQIEDAGHTVTTHANPGKTGSSTRYILGFGKHLRAANLLENKHIPDAYLRASVTQRRALLAGIMDTDGHCPDARGQGRGKGASRCELTFTDERLSLDALALIRSLGIRASCQQSDAKLYGRVVSQRWRIGFQSDFNPFSVSRKAERWIAPRTKRSQYRYVCSVEPIEPKPMRCISVDSPDSSFLVTEHYIPTHNSVWLRWVAACAAAGRHPFRGGGSIPQMRALIIDAENPDHVIADGLRMMRSNLSENLTILARPGGLDIRKRQDRTLLHRVCEQVRPDLICIGPLYKIHRPDPREDDEAAAVRCQQILDDLRVRFDCALILEHHAPKGNANSRQLVPFGSSAWLRWPEFGWKLIPHNTNTGKDHPEGESLRLGTFRGDRVRINKPTRFDRGGITSPWPWVSYWADGIPRDDESF